MWAKKDEMENSSRKRKLSMAEVVGCTRLPRRARPIIKLSGLMSRCRKHLLCTYSTREIYVKERRVGRQSRRDHEEFFGLLFYFSWTVIVNKPHHLICEEQHGFDREFAVAKVEEIFQAGAQQLHDHDIVVALHAKPLDLWNALWLMAEGENDKRGDGR